eukprot:3607723-Amphidinium_carterae.1
MILHHSAVACITVYAYGLHPESGPCLVSLHTAPGDGRLDMTPFSGAPLSETAAVIEVPHSHKTVELLVANERPTKCTGFADTAKHRPMDSCCVA